MKRLGLLMAAALVLASCSMINRARNGDVAGAVADGASSGVDAARAESRARDEIKVKCDPPNNAPVGWTEERSAGGAVMIGTLSQGYFIDKDDEHDPAKLAERVNKKEDIQLSASDRNDLNAYVERVGGNLASFSSRPGIPWAFGVVESATPNAMSAPGGYVIVTTGLLKQMDNEAQLAGVLAHEIAHVTQGHSLKTYKEERYGLCTKVVRVKAFKDVGISALPGELQGPAIYADDILRIMGNNGFDLDNATGKVIAFFMDSVVSKLSSGHSKEDEFEADAVGIALVSAAGYDASEYGKLISKLPSGGGTFEHHPAAADRVAKLDAWRGENTFSAGNAKPPIQHLDAIK